MTLVESWTSAARRQPQFRFSSSHSTRRVAARCGSGRRRGRRAVRRVAVRRYSRGRSRRRPVRVQGRTQLARTVDRDARGLGCKRGSAQIRPELRHADREDRRASHGNAERNQGLRGAVPRDPRERDLRRVHRHRVQLAHRSERSDLRRSLGPGLSVGRGAHRRARRCQRARRARDLSQHEHHRDRADGHLRHRRPVTSDARCARDASRVEVRALGYRPARARLLRRDERPGREPVQHLRPSRHVRNRLSRPARRADAAVDSRASCQSRRRSRLLDRDGARTSSRVRRCAAREHGRVPADEPDRGDRR